MITLSRLLACGTVLVSLSRVLSGCGDDDAQKQEATGGKGSPSAGGEGPSAGGSDAGGTSGDEGGAEGFGGGCAEGGAPCWLGEPSIEACDGEGEVANGTDAAIQDFEALDSADLESSQKITSQGEVAGGLTGVVSDSGDMQWSLVEGHGGDSAQALELGEDAAESPFSFMFVSGACTDVSAYDGISFWARSDNADEFITIAYFRNLQSTPSYTYFEGECSWKTCTLPLLEIALTEDWQKFDLYWDEFEDPDAPDGEDIDLRVQSFGLYLSPETNKPTDIFLQVDDVRFLGGE
jgi:hypothetical protein